MSSNEIGRRFFLRIVGATGAAAACSPKHAPEKLVPLLVPPENIVPGKVLEYRTVCRSCTAGCGVTARTREGRAIKLEGNPDDPISGGALCARGQAAVQDLYSPERLKGPLQRQGSALVAIGWDAALEALALALGKAKGRTALLTRPEPGAAGEVQRAFMTALGGRRAVLGNDELEPLRSASQLLFGRAELPAWDLSAARSVVSFGADFVETWHSPVELARGLASGRGRTGESRTRFTWVGPRLSTTASTSDLWLRVRPGGERDTALLLLRWLVDPVNAVPALSAEAGLVRGMLHDFDAKAALARSGATAEQIGRLGRELSARRPSAILGPGMQSAGVDATELAAALLLANLILGNIGRTVLYGQDPAADPPAPASVRTLLQDCAAGKVDVLFLHRADPVGDLPASLRAAEALGHVPFLVTFSDRLDASTRLAHLVLPDRHALESFDVFMPRKGVVAVQQPAMAPLAETRPMPQLLADLAGRLQLTGVPSDFRDYARTRAAARAAELGESDSKALFARGVASAKVSSPPIALRPKGLAGLGTRRPAEEGLALVPFPTALPVADPGAAPWLREVPDLLSGLSWTSWAELSIATAQRTGVRDGEQLAVTTAQGEALLIVRVNPALHDEAVAIPGSAPELLALLPAAFDARSGALATIGTGARVRKVGPVQALVAALAPMVRGQEGRDLARAVSASSPALPPPPEHREMIAEPEHPVHRWGMAIDLDRCTGCQACVVACYAENNIPVNGAEFANAGRSMAWLRIQRSYEPRQDGGVKLRVLPSLCQHCDAAPCEPVCPVFATYHTPDGLNAQVYNRCIGTRYCANNCPYDARVFNWRSPSFVAPLDLQLNPDVTVRDKGIMEKCTFCVQRIRAGSFKAKEEGRAMVDGDVTPACAQTCPAQAIVFGDLKDPQSRVSQLAVGPRGYSLLDELNTRPAITYLARVEDEV